jgi:hypothetical protein
MVGAFSNFQIYKILGLVDCSERREKQMIKTKQKTLK